MIPSVDDGTFDPQKYALQLLINKFNNRNNSQPAIGNKVVTDAIVGLNNAITPPIASVVTPLVNTAGNIVGGASSFVKYAAIGLGAIVLIKILK